jgi:hypothetical protein
VVDLFLNLCFDIILLYFLIAHVNFCMHDKNNVSLRIHYDSLLKVNSFKFIVI